MKIKRTVLLFLSCLAVFASCSENKDAKELFAKVESVMEEHPDSALAMLDSAYGEIMASGYNCRKLPVGYTKILSILFLSLVHIF